MPKCSKKNDLIRAIGKPYDRFTEDEWDMLIDHTENCPICIQNSKIAEEIINSGLRDAIREEFSDFKFSNQFC